MRRFSTTFLAVAFVFLNFALPGGTAYAQTATILGLYPAAEVPIGAKVTFTVGTSGFTNPTFYLTDSFPGGVTSVYIDSQGDFSWTPNQSEVGSHGLTITVSDSLGDSASVSQTITVDGAAGLSIPTPTPGSTVSIGTPVSFTVSPSGLLNPTYTVADAFSYSSLQSYALNASGEFSWTPIAQDIGSHTIIVTAKDSYGNTASASTVITVLPTPTLSIVALSPGASVDVNQPVTFVATSTGFVGPTYAISDAFSGISTSTVSIDPSSGKASWTPQYNDIGVHSLTVTASDGTGRSLTATISIKVLSQIFTPAQTPVTATSTTTSPVQSASPVTAPSVSQPPVIQTQTSAPQTQTAQSPSTPNTNAPAETQTSPLFSDAGAAPATSSGSIGADVTIPTPPPVESIGGFFFGGIVNFFASIFKIF